MSSRQNPWLNKFLAHEPRCPGNPSAPETFSYFWPIGPPSPATAGCDQRRTGEQASTQILKREGAIISSLMDSPIAPRRELAFRWARYRRPHRHTSVARSSRGSARSTCTISLAGDIQRILREQAADGRIDYLQMARPLVRRFDVRSLSGRSVVRRLTRLL